jgi:hypothetical protein
LHDLALMLNPLTKGNGFLAAIDPLTSGSKKQQHQN